MNMFEQDHDVLRVAPEFIRTNSGTWPGAKGPMPLSLQRWGEYKYLFSICSLEHGLERGPLPGDVFFLAWSRGLLDRASDFSSFLHCVRCCSLQLVIGPARYTLSFLPGKQHLLAKHSTARRDRAPVPIGQSPSRT